uniref:DUF4346 domain-containing protein n=1 Tax=Liagoropsis maxima TaxID=1653392 RepID=A0A1G4NVT9_9FLOR|nr:Hypothetical protein ORF_1 [Liagoropsis maxima]SCW22745.1 Hypothetical protein ORF_1 [Liagoropsis maxima]
MFHFYPHISQSFIQKSNHFDSLMNTSLPVIEDQLYCIISTRLNGQIMIDFHVSKDNPISDQKNKYRVLFTSYTSHRVSDLIQRHDTICSKLSINHSLYIGMELVKAEVCLIMQQQYCQN